MEPRIKLLIADYENELSDNIRSFLKENTDIELIGTYTDGKCAWEAILQHKPDVILINMFLPIIDGLGLMEKVNKITINKPRAICFSAVQNDFMVRQMFALGVSYYAVLPIEVDILMQRVTDIFNDVAVNELKPSSPPAKPTATTKAEEQITSILLSIGIPANIKGYQYLREAVKLAIADADIVNKITKELYPQIARRFDTTASKVERAVRHAIDVAWNRGRIKNMNEIFGIEIYSHNDRPTNGEFIALVADRIRLSNSHIKLR